VTVEAVVFAVAAAIAVMAALGVVLARTPVLSVILLIVNFFALAALYLVLSASFLAAVQVLVYAGAIMVLFLFVVMLLSPGREPRRLGGLPGQLAGAVALVALSLLSLAWLVLASPGTISSSLPPISGDYGTAPALGRALFTRYLLPFEATAFLLLVAVVGVVLLARRHPPARAGDRSQPL
jgi:NADH-quinone oxidoreductase subunit J